MVFPAVRAPVMKITHGAPSVPTKTCSVPAGQCTKSHARRRRSTPAINSRHSPARTRKSSWPDSAWYMPVGLPGSSTASVNPICGNIWGSTSGRSTSTRGLPSNAQRLPNASLWAHADSATLTTNQPGVTGARPDPTSSSRASSTITAPFSATQVRVAAVEPVLARRREDVDVERVLERHRGVRQIRGYVQHLAGGDVDLLRLVVAEAEAQHAFEDVGDLLVVVRVLRDDRALCEIHVRDHHRVAGDEPAPDFRAQLLARHVFPAVVRRIGHDRTIWSAIPPRAGRRSTVTGR